MLLSSECTLAAWVLQVRHIWCKSINALMQVHSQGADCQAPSSEICHCGKQACQVDAAAAAACQAGGLAHGINSQAAAQIPLQQHI